MDFRVLRDSMRIIRDFKRFLGIVQILKRL